MTTKVRGCPELGMGLGLGCQEARGNWWGDTNILKLDCGAAQTAVRIHNNDLTAHTYSE